MLIIAFINNQLPKGDYIIFVSRQEYLLHSKLV